MTTLIQRELFMPIAMSPEDHMACICNAISSMPIDEKVECLNRMRFLLHQQSPFKNEPVDFVQWIKSDLVHANDYNPNSVAPPEMKLLEKSIACDGYTQPIVAWSGDTAHEVVDGFHRNRVGKESEIVRKRVNGYLPLVSIRPDREGKNDRVAATIRHNRARGKHKVTAMSDIVIELKRRNWSDNRIAEELGMDQDEILRLCQITGLADLFKDSDFSKAWDVGDDDGSEVSLDEQPIETHEENISHLG